jgi:hypothetical protein
MASIEPLNKRALNRIRFISDVVPFSREYATLKGVYNARRGRSRKVLVNAVTGEVFMFPIEMHRPALKQACGPNSNHPCPQREQGDFEHVFYPSVLRE